jgi:hypothetical protein
MIVWSNDDIGRQLEKTCSAGKHNFTNQLLTEKNTFDVLQQRTEKFCGVVC